MVKSIDLTGAVKNANDISFLRVEWWDDSSRFVLVRYSRAGKEQEFGLRLDLDKKIFLDHFEDTDLDKKVQTLVEPIWSIVAHKRWGRLPVPL